MQVVRVLWGSISNFLNEIPASPQFNDIVYTFEYENYIKLTTMGYDVQLIDISKKNTTDWFKNKLILLNEVLKDFKEFLFLDWDVVANDDILDISELKFNKKFNIPLYQYPPNYYIDLIKTEDTQHWFYLHEKTTKLLNYWTLSDNSIILPCFCFYYNDDLETIPTLIKISDEYDFRTCTEEFSFYVYVTKYLGVHSLEDYISKIEPIYLYGREIDYIHNYITYPYNTLNKFIGDRLKKDIKFKHI
jgi:hypothetical protein